MVPKPLTSAEMLTILNKHYPDGVVDWKKELMMLRAAVWDYFTSKDEKKEEAFRALDIVMQVCNELVKQPDRSASQEKNDG